MDISGMLTGAGATAMIWVLVSQVRDVVKAKRAEREREEKAFRNWIDHRIESVDTRVNGVRKQAFDALIRVEKDAMAKLAEFEKRQAAFEKRVADTFSGVERSLTAAQGRLTEVDRRVKERATANQDRLDSMDGRLDNALTRINAAEKSINAQAATHSEFAHNIVDRLCALEAPLQSAEAPKTLPQAPAEWYRNHEAASMPLGTHEWPKNPKA